MTPKNAKAGAGMQPAPKIVVDVILTHPRQSDQVELLNSVRDLCILAEAFDRRLAEIESRIWRAQK